VNLTHSIQLLYDYTFQNEPIKGISKTKLSTNEIKVEKQVDTQKLESIDVELSSLKTQLEEFQNKVDIIKKQIQIKQTEKEELLSFKSASIADKKSSIPEKKKTKKTGKI
jgi:hypothetical protein